MSKPSRYQLHVEKWSEGCGSECCERADRVVFARGKIPCDILFVGEAPGPSENNLGVPFVGPAGRMLDHIIQRALPGNTVDDVFDPEPRLAFYNIVGCIPRDEDGRKAMEPSLEQRWKCQAKMLEFIELANPRLIVTLGSVARDALDPQAGGNIWVVYPDTVAGENVPKKSLFKRLLHADRHIGAKIPRLDLIHPAAILRANVAQKGYLVQRCVVQLSTAYEEWFVQGPTAV